MTDAEDLAFAAQVLALNVEACAGEFSWLERAVTVAQELPCAIVSDPKVAFNKAVEVEQALKVHVDSIPHLECIAKQAENLRIELGWKWVNSKGQ